MDDSAILVFTSRPAASMLHDGGAQRWVLNEARARACSYVICAWNSKGKHAKGAPNRPHGEGFLVAKIKSIGPTADHDSSARFIIRFAEYALVNVPGIWDHRQRNPVAYTSLHELGIDPTQLAFKPMEIGPETEPQPKSAPPLSIEMAKRGLAAMFQVAPEAIEIIIHA